MKCVAIEGFQAKRYGDLSAVGKGPFCLESRLCVSNSGSWKICAEAEVQATEGE